MILLIVNCYLVCTVMPFECLYKPSGDLCNLFGSEVVKSTRVHGDRRLRTESAWSRFEDRLELRCSSEGFRFRLSREDAVCGGGDVVGLCKR